MMGNIMLHWIDRQPVRWISNHLPKVGRPLLLLCLLLFLSACGEAGPRLTEEIAPEELPTGIGRGFPVATLHGIDNDDTGLTSGAMPPNFYMVLDDGRYLSLANLHGHPVLINFWATWCGPCRLEMPEIVAEANRNPDLIVLAVNVQEELTQLQPFAEDFAMTMPVVLDSDATLRQLYEVSGMPTSVFIDSEGKIDTVWRGILTPDALREFVDQME
ncbi:MAG TPA: TlpA disulfide reductase family protein [Caldilineaceae bacterium]|mgnify:CR=1 FL=1|nr:TlpA disulfide reductase family protein [Caldilineaceae bacterium]